MRGKPELTEISLQSTRITPADAGKTYDNTVKTEPREDHPRGCGENLLFAHKSTILTGSPPRMRGKHERAFSFLRDWGITPADAGKTAP